ncbi:hypothetical protein LTR94_026459, partial [Friedmanniomyces endolithicus]
LILSGHQAIGPDLEFAIDALFNRRDISSMLALTENSGYLNTPVNKSFALAPSLAWRINADWTLSLSGLYGRDRTDYDQRFLSNGTVASSAYGCYCNVARSVELSAEGKLLELPAGDLRLAIGGGYRYNSFEDTNASGSQSNGGGSIDSSYAFGELNVPVISPEQDFNWAYRISINGALRYERYPGIGDVATPKLGLSWAMTPDISLKGSWGKSFRAPTLYQQYQPRAVYLFPPAALGATGTSASAGAILILGGNPDLKPEKATTWSTTLALHPRALPGASLEVSYFSVRYRDRIVSPITLLAQALSNPIYRDQIIFNPSATQQAAAIASAGTFLNISGVPYEPANVVAIVDNANLNAGRQRARGIDVLASYDAAIAPDQRLRLSLDIANLESDQQLSAGQPTYDLAGTIFNPPHWRGQAAVAWTGGNLTLAANGNYTGGVSDTRSTPAVRVNAMTTLDLTARYRVDPEAPLGGLEFSLSVQNLFND